VLCSGNNEFLRASGGVSHPGPVLSPLSNRSALAARSFHGSSRSKGLSGKPWQSKFWCEPGHESCNRKEGIGQMSTILMTASNFQRFIEDRDILALAQILRHDQQICSAGGVSSLVVVKLNGISQTLADGFAGHLLTGKEASKVPLSILRLQYNEVLVSINAHAQRTNHSRATVCTDIDTKPTLASSELKAALKVLQVLIDSTDLDPHKPVSDAITAIQPHLDEHDELRTNEAQHGVPSISSHCRVCYICKMRISTSRTSISLLVLRVP
jgi:hypothetical protein